MKKILFALAATAGMLFASSCVKEAVEGVGSGEPVQVSFNVGFDNALSTRAIADGTGADVLYYQVFENSTPVAEPETTEITEKSASVKLTLISGKTYQVAFWAQNSECEAYDLSDLSAVKVDYDNALNNDETRDAFCKAITFTVGTNNPEEAVKLTRPFAQINVGAQEFAHLDIKKSQMVVKANSIYTQYNILTEEASEINGAPVTFAANELVDADLTVGEETYTYLSMSYVLAGDADLADVDFEFYNDADQAVLSLNVESVPVGANQRTNLLGKVVNEEVDVDIVIDDGQEDEDNDEPDQPFEEQTPKVTASVSFPQTDATEYYIPVAFGTGYEAAVNASLQIDAVLSLDAPADEDVEFNVSIDSSIPWDYDSTVTIEAGETSVIIPLTLTDRTSLSGAESTGEDTYITISTDSDKVKIKETDYGTFDFAIASNFFVKAELTKDDLSCEWTADNAENVANLVNGDTSGGTYWESLYYAGSLITTHPEYHVYIDITLPSAAAAVQFKHYPRNSGVAPTSLKYAAVTDGQPTQLGTKTCDSGNVDWQTSDEFTLATPSDNVWFGILESAQGDLYELEAGFCHCAGLRELEVWIKY